MSFTKEEQVKKAVVDLAERLSIAPDQVRELGVSDSEFPDMSLGSSEKNEVSAQIISTGWRIKLGANGKKYEYRADKYQLRLHNFNGANHVIE
ncbi:MAG: hypothetical protein ABIV48_02625 [Pyrinomonadaceae bacterium]